MTAEPETTQLPLAYEIPVIDVSAIYSNNLAEREAIAETLRDAANNTTFFYIVNHGVPLELMDEARAAYLDYARQYLGDDIKAAAEKRALDDDFDGLYNEAWHSVRYWPEGFPEITTFEREPPENVMLRLRTWGLGAGTEMLDHARFEAAMGNHFDGCAVLAKALTDAFCLSIGEPGYHDDLEEFTNTVWGLNYCPRVTDGGKPGPMDVSVCSITDYRLFTILWQDSNGVLRVFKYDEQWYKARSMRDTLVIYMDSGIFHNELQTGYGTLDVRNLSGRKRLTQSYFCGLDAPDGCGVLDDGAGTGEVQKVATRLANMRLKLHGPDAPDGCEVQTAARGLADLKLTQAGGAGAGGDGAAGAST